MELLEQLLPDSIQAVLTYWSKIKENEKKISDNPARISAFFGDFLVFENGALKTQDEKVKKLDEDGVYLLSFAVPVAQRHYFVTFFIKLKEEVSGFKIINISTSAPNSITSTGMLGLELELQDNEIYESLLVYAERAGFWDIERTQKKLRFFPKGGPSIHWYSKLTDTFEYLSDLLGFLLTLNQLAFNKLLVLKIYCKRGVQAEEPLPFLLYAFLEKHELDFLCEVTVEPLWDEY